MNKQKIRLSFLLLGLLFGFSVKAVDLSAVSRSVEAFKTYSTYMNEKAIIDGIEILFDHKFLSNEDEAAGEAHDAFELNLAGNVSKLKKFANAVYLKELKAIRAKVKNHKQYGVAVREAGDRFENLKAIDRVVLASIGTSSTQIYYVKNNVRKYHFFSMGTTDSKARAQEIEKMFKILNKLQRPVIFFNAIAFANPIRDKKVKGYHICDLNNPYLKFNEEKVDKSGKPIVGKDNKIEIDNSSVLANILQQRISKENHFAGFIFKTADKADKFSNKWTNSIAASMFAPDEFGLIVDNGGGGFSIREVNNQKVDTESKDLVEILKVKDWDQYKNQKDIVAAYAEGPEDPKFIHKTLVENKQKMLEVIGLYIGKNKERFQGVKQLKVVIRQTGQLRELKCTNSAITEKNKDGERKEEGRDKKPESDKKVEGPKVEAPVVSTPSPKFENDIKAEPKPAAANTNKPGVVRHNTRMILND